MAAEISLNCWILGLDIVNHVPVEIVLSETVNDLRKEIKEVLALAKLRFSFQVDACPPILTSYQDV